jgi:hypothetical protein
LYLVDFISFLRKDKDSKKAQKRKGTKVQWKKEGGRGRQDKRQKTKDKRNREKETRKKATERPAR